MHRLLSLAILVGCSCGTPSGAPSSPGTTTTTGSASTTATTTYSVHEWGLVRAGPGDTLSVGAMGERVPRELLVVEKPVLYFHLGAAASLDLASVRVDALGGSIVEHWPHTGVSALPLPTSVSWLGLRLEPAPCALEPPRLDARPCSDLAVPSDCESLLLRTAATDDSACIHTTGATSPLLFYRSTSNALTAPLSFEALDVGELNIRNDGELPIPGRVIRFRREGDVVRVVVVDPPAPHTTIVVGHGWGEPALAREAVTTSLLGLGLTASEAAAFLSSWDHAFFGVPPSELPVREDMRERVIAEERMPPEESVLYFLPAADIERVARLSFDPAPTEIRRAMAVWTALR